MAIISAKNKSIGTSSTKNDNNLEEAATCFVVIVSALPIAK